MGTKVKTIFIFISLIFLGVTFSSFAEEEKENSHIYEVMDSYQEVLDSLQGATTVVQCEPLEEPKFQRKNEHALCSRQFVEAAASFYYMNEEGAQSQLRKQIKGGIPNRSIKRRVSESEVSILPTNKSYEIRFQFGRAHAPKNIAVFYRDKNGQQMSCEYEDSPKLYDRIARTQRKMQLLSRKDQQAWIRFCKEHPAYEKRAESFEKSNWIQVGGRGDNPNERIIYNRCPAGIRWKDFAAKAMCARSGEGGYPLLNPSWPEAFPNLELPKAIMYYFDGYGDFNAARAKETVNAQNVRGDEKGDAFLGFKNANGLKFYEREIFYNYSPSDIQFMYYDGTGQKQSHNEQAAANCHDDMNEWLNVIKAVYPQVTLPKKVAMGYSNGAAAALKFQSTISKDHLFSRKRDKQLDLLITLDPISRPAGYIINKATGINFLSERSETTARHVNLYQDIDYGSMEMLELRGTKVESADENIYISSEDMGLWDGEKAHIKLLKSPRVGSKVYCEVHNILDDSFDLCLD